MRLMRFLIPQSWRAPERGSSVSKKDKIPPGKRISFEKKLKGKKHKFPKSVADKVFSSGDDLTGQELSDKLCEECKKFPKG